MGPLGEMYVYVYRSPFTSEHSCRSDILFEYCFDDVLEYCFDVFDAGLVH